MGRPKKELHELRSDRLNVRLTPAEMAYVETQARAAGLDAVEYIRRRALGYQVPPAPGRADAALLMDLNRLGVELNAIGTNVNQLARAMNAGRTFNGSWSAIHGRLESTRADIGVALDRLAIGE